MKEGRSNNKTGGVSTKNHNRPGGNASGCSQATSPVSARAHFSHVAPAELFRVLAYTSPRISPRGREVFSAGIPSTARRIYRHRGLLTRNGIKSTCRYPICRKIIFCSSAYWITRQLRTNHFLNHEYLMAVVHIFWPGLVHLTSLRSVGRAKCQIKATRKTRKEHN